MRADWVEVELGEILKVSSGQALTAKNMSGSGFPVYGGNGVAGYHNEFIFEEPKLIIGRVGVKCGVTHITKSKSWVTDNALVVDFKIKNVNISYMQLRLQFEDLNKLSNSTAQPVISGAKLYNHRITLPPLPEQRAIVAKIEQLFSDLDNGIANLKAAQAKLDIYRQAVLKQAFEGELTREWREKQTDLPSGADLLEIINLEKKDRKKGQAKTKIIYDNKPKNYTYPATWLLIKAFEFSPKITDGEHITPQRSESGYYLLSARNIQNGYIDYSAVDYVQEDEFQRIRKRCNPEKGDILISCSGSVGRVTQVPANDDFVMVRSVALFKVYKNLVVDKYLEYLFRSPFVQTQIEKGKKATAQANLFLAPIGNLELLVCSLQEQHQIVQEIESRLSVCDKLADTIQTSLQQAEALRQSILKKAFEGRLLTETELQACKAEADWMPAEQLLAQIKSSKAK